MKLDSLVGVGAVGRLSRNLKKRATKLYRIVLGDGALILEAQRLLQASRLYFLPDGKSFGGQL